MTENTSDSPTGDAGQSVERLCGEVSLLRRAIEGLAAERQAAPDYGPTLDVIDDHMSQFVGWARQVAETPLLKMTPEVFEKEIARVAISARQADRETIQRYDASMAAAIQGIDRVTDSAWEASAQWRALLITGAISALMAVVLTLALVRLYGSAAITTVSQAAPSHVAAVPSTTQLAPPAHRRPGGVAPRLNSRTSSPAYRLLLTSVD